MTEDKFARWYALLINTGMSPEEAAQHITALRTEIAAKAA